MQTFATKLDDNLWLHKEPSSITVSQDGSVDLGLGAGSSPKIHDTGPGCWAPGTVLRVNVKNADVGTGATYLINLLCRTEGGSFLNFGTFEILGGTANEMKLFPVSNLGFDGVAYDEVKVNLELGGTSPDLDVTVMIVDAPA